MGKDVVRNAADKRQVKAAVKKEKMAKIDQRTDLKWVLSDPRGRRSMWRLLEYCQAFSSVFHTNALTMSNNAGRQDVGHYLMSEITEADEDMFFQMQIENRKEIEDV